MVRPGHVFAGLTISKLARFNIGIAILAAPLLYVPMYAITSASLMA